ncbi:hypothetical protein [Georgenia faecalis]|uniref:Uncharacterized protein n=1 Tax=Georgenia faecalis TaxID=2483799 RepID=A0ABV9D518_9MICO|nr:hypothetical protein [Georgenia faecalis]
MRLFDRRRPAPVSADVGPGFWVAEASAVQHAIVSALTAAERAGAGGPATLQLSPGAEGRVVVQWRNLIVGFAPPTSAASLRRQLEAAGKAPVVLDGRVVVAPDGLWRIWAGPGEPVGPPPGAEADEIAPATSAIFGIALRGPAASPRRATAPAPDGAPSSEAAAAGPVGRQILEVGTHSWEVRDGVDVDLALLRRRLADAAPGATLHVRVWEEPVSIHLAPLTRVTLTDLATGSVEVLYPR